MRLGGWPAQLVCTMTCTSEISGSASRGIFRNDQIPASTSRSVATKTRKRFSAHQSIQRAITLHPPRNIQPELFCRDRLSILFRQDTDLPRSSAIELCETLVDSVSFFGESDRCPHGGHAHRRHCRHGERDRDVRARKRSAACISKLHSNNVAPTPWRSRVGREFGACLRRVCCAGTCAGRRRNKRTECRL